MEKRNWIKIVVGSKSTHKIAAVRGACGKIGLVHEVVGVVAKSDVNEQPYGLDETRLGAWNRAKNASQADQDANAWIGIESGLVNANGCYFDVTMIVIILPNGRVLSSIAGGHQVPHADVYEAMGEGFKTTTAGDKMKARTGCDSTDGTSFVTRGVVSRAECIEQAVTIALAEAFPS